MVTLDDLTELPDEADLPPLDRSDVDEAALSGVQRLWRAEGAVVIPELIHEDLVDAYVDRYQRDGVEPAGYTSAVPYMHVEELRAICLDDGLQAYLTELVGEPTGVHLNLTGWVSTERNWHQDDYLNPPFINSWYAAVWVALDDISIDAGPFEYVPGSHRLPVVRRQKMLDALTPQEAASSDWPRYSERVLTPLYEELIEQEGLEVRQFVASKGDVLIWHGRLLHRGSEPRVPGLPRRALISHYSAVSRRRDMPVTATERGHTYFVLAG